MISIREAENKDKELVYNLMQKYQYELSEYYGDMMDENGNYEYKYLPLYFTEKKRHALFFYEDKTLVGFSLVNDFPFVNEPVDYCIAEFTIFPYFRKNGRAESAVESMVKKYPGRWQLKYDNCNETAARFWQKIKSKYSGREFALEENETAVAFEI